MKKVLSRLIPLLLAAMLIITACAPQADTPPAAQPTPQPPDVSTPATAPPPADDLDDLLTEPVTLRMQSWALGTEEENNWLRQLIKAFEEDHPGVTVEIVSVPPDEDYDGYLMVQAAERNLPDVFMRWSAADTVTKGWAMDVTRYAEADPDYMAVVPSLRDSGKYNNRVFAIPNGMFIFGFVQNHTLMEDINVEPLPYNYTMDDLIAKIAECTTDKYRGTDNFEISEWGPFVLAPEKNIGFGTFDGNRFNYASPEFAEAIAIWRNLGTRGMTANTWLFPDDSWNHDGWAFGDGVIALQFDGSWSANFVANEASWNGDFIPLPGGKMAIVPDYMFVGANTEHAELAYRLLAYISYSTPGTLRRLDIHKADGTLYQGFPLNPGHIREADDFIRESLASMPGLFQMYLDVGSNPNASIVEAAKFVPGYMKARFNDGDTGLTDAEGNRMGIGGLINAIIQGERNLADYAQEMEDLANRYYEEAIAEMMEFIS